MHSDSFAGRDARQLKFKVTVVTQYIKKMYIYRHLYQFQYTEITGATPKPIPEYSHIVTYPSE
jgi:hypothetical protein